MAHQILLVDDYEELLAALELKLRKEGYQIDTAPDGEVALEKIRDSLPDLVIPDVNMLRMNGMDVCKALRSDDKTRDLAIIMLTARNVVGSGSQGVLWNPAFLLLVEANFQPVVPFTGDGNQGAFV